MTSLKTHMKNMKDDVKEGIQKVGHTIKNTAFDLKGEAKGVMQNFEDKKYEFYLKELSLKSSFLTSLSTCSLNFR